MTGAIAFIDLRAQYARLKPAIDAGIARVLAHGRFILGPEVEEFERALAEHAGVGQVVSCASGTDALIIALMAEGVGPGDLVFLPAFTFTATAEAVLLLGARPVFVDVDERSYLIDLADLEARIAAPAAAGRARAIVAVDLFGQPADYAGLDALARRHGLFLLADAAQSCGAALDGRRVGGLAPATAISFYPSKPLACYGDGGALMTDDRARADAYRSIRVHGTGVGRYDVVRLGLNSRLDTIQAAVLLAKLPVLDSEIAARARVAERYDATLAPCAGLPARLPGRQSAWAHYTIRLDARDRVAAALEARGIPTAVHYPLPMHLQKAYARFGDGPGSLPVAERLARRVLSLPLHADLDDATIERICAAVRKAAGSEVG